MVNKNERGLTGVCLSACFFLTTYSSLLHNMNFSKTSGVLVSVGLVIFAHYVKGLCKKKNTVFHLISGIMIFAGGLVRRDSIIAALPFVILLAMDTVLQCRNKGIKSIKASEPWLILVLLIVVAWMTDTIAYKVNGEWRNYKEFNDIRVNLDDYGMLDYETHQEIYQGIGYDYVDVRMLSSWHSADSEVFSAENLKEIVQNKAEKEYSYVNIKQSLKKTYEEVIKDNDMFVVIVLLTLVCGVIDRKKLFLLIPNFLLLILELFYLVFGERYPERATLLVFMYAFAVLIYVFPPKEELKKVKYGLVTVTLLIFVVVGLYNNNFKEIIEKNDIEEYAHKEEYRQFLVEISEQQENLYVWDIFAIEKVLDEAYIPYEAFDVGVLSNSVYTGGWFVNTPIMANNAERFGEKNNPYKLLANSKNVFLVTRVDTDISDTLSYICRHYNKDAESRCVAKLNEIAVYTFTEE